jgi:hypothetical protein
MRFSCEEVTRTLTFSPVDLNNWTGEFTTLVTKPLGMFFEMFAPTFPASINKRYLVCTLLHKLLEINHNPLWPGDALSLPASSPTFSTVSTTPRQLIGPAILAGTPILNESSAVSAEKRLACSLQIGLWLHCLAPTMRALRVPSPTNCIHPQHPARHASLRSMTTLNRVSEPSWFLSSCEGN